MFSSLKLINAIIEHADEQGLTVETFFFDTEKEMAGHLLWDIWSIENDVSLETEDWDTMDILIKSNWIKKGMEEFDLRKLAICPAVSCLKKFKQPNAR